MDIGDLIGLLFFDEIRDLALGFTTLGLRLEVSEEKDGSMNLLIILLSQISLVIFGFSYYTPSRTVLLSFKGYFRFQRRLVSIPSSN